MSFTNRQKEIAQKFLLYMKPQQVQNVYVWSGGYGLKFGLVGKPLALQRYFLNDDEPIPNEDHYLIRHASRAFDFPIEWSGNGPFEFPSPNFWGSSSNIFSGEYLDGLGGMLQHVLDTDEEVEVTLIPEPGYPWSAKRVLRYYDTKKDKVITSKKPGWITTGDFTDPYTSEPTTGFIADYCKLFPSVNLGEQFPQTLMRLPRGTEAMVTHSFELPRTPEGDDRKRIIELGQQIKKCGGLLFPSLAVGLIPASNFGPITFVMNVGCALTGLHPYRPRGKYPVHVYNTDVWTENVIALKGRLARELFLELTAQTMNWIYKHDLLALGPILRLGQVGTDIQPRQLKNVRELETTIKKRFRFWSTVVEPSKWVSKTELGIGATANQTYAYLEAKVTNILGLENIKFVVCQEEFKESVKLFMKSLGLKIPIYTLDGDVHKLPFILTLDELERELANYPELDALQDAWQQAEYLRYRFAWDVAKVIREVGEKSVLDLEG